MTSERSVRTYSTSSCHMRTKYAVREPAQSFVTTLFVSVAVMVRCGTSSVCWARCRQSLEVTLYMTISDRKLHHCGDMLLLHEYECDGFDSPQTLERSVSFTLLSTRSSWPSMKNACFYRPFAHCFLRSRSMSPDRV